MVAVVVEVVGGGDSYVNTAVDHTTNLLRRVFRASGRLHDRLTTSTKRSSTCLTK